MIRLTDLADLIFLFICPELGVTGLSPTETQLVQARLVSKSSSYWQISDSRHTKPVQIF